MEWNPPSPEDQLRHEPARVFNAGLALHHLANTAYPIGHLTTMRPYRTAPVEVQAQAAAAWEEVGRLGLYVHIPFCEARCGYCEYTVLDPAANSVQESPYFDLLLAEFDLYRDQMGTENKQIMGFDIGGGTPALAPPDQIARVISAADRSFKLPEEVTISLETTPKIAARDPAKIKALYDLGIRRISMGVQTINPRLLQELGRESTTLGYNLSAAENIRTAGFDRFNVDIMYGFAGQPLHSVEATVQHVIGLNPEYITLYRMRYKGTRIASQASGVGLDAIHAQQSLLKAALHAAGYQATPGKNTFSCLPGDPGTSDYLTGRVIHGTPYLGLGLGAQSLSEKTLSYNSGAADKQMRLYRQKLEKGELPIQDLYHLSLPAAMAKMISVSFYFGEISLPSFQNKFGLPLEAAFQNEVAFVLQAGLMEYAGPEPATLRLTALGEKQVNGVIALFYAPAVQQHLLNLAASENKPAPAREKTILPLPAAYV